MSCCGGKRAQLMQSKPASNPEVSGRYASKSEQKRIARFEFTGIEPFSVHGLVTGKLYSFMTNGAIVEVDTRDVYSLLPFSSIRKI
jgi:hypothetical protein